SVAARPVLPHCPSFHLLNITQSSSPIFSLFFFNDTATTEIYTLSLHDALPISESHRARSNQTLRSGMYGSPSPFTSTLRTYGWRSEEHTSELQSRSDLVCRLLLEKKKKRQIKKKEYYTTAVS